MPGRDDGAGQMAQDPYQGSVAADPDRRLTGTPAERSARDELRRRQETMVRVVLRPIGCPLALGFVALAAATLVVSGLQLSWVQPAEGRNVALGFPRYLGGSVTWLQQVKPGCQRIAYGSTPPRTRQGSASQACAGCDAGCTSRRSSGPGQAQPPLWCGSWCGRRAPP